MPHRQQDQSKQNGLDLGILIGKMSGVEDAIAELKEGQRDTREMIMRSNRDGREEMMRAIVEMNDSLKIHLERDDRYQEKTDGRIDAIEKDKIKVMGIAAGVAAILSGGINGVIKMLGGAS